jgi:hypothetical protein
MRELLVKVGFLTSSLIIWKVWLIGKLIFWSFDNYQSKIQILDLSPYPPILYLEKKEPNQIGYHVSIYGLYLLCDKTNIG